MQTINRALLRQEAAKELARREFFYYCRLMAPDFYRPGRTYLARLCGAIEGFLASDDDVLVISLPPRHGKSRTAGKAVEWILGGDHHKKVMTGSYNETLSTAFSKGVRNTIMEVKAQPDRLVYSDIFPGCTIKQGDAAMNLWSLTGGYNNYLATSPGGTATGFGADYLFIDDLIKREMEARNERLLEKQWVWFTDTMLSRLEAGGKVFIIMTRWHSRDLAGRAMRDLPAEGWRVRQLTMKALQDDGTMLCADILPLKDYQRRSRAMGADIASANYQQEPIDQRGRLYQGFKTYTQRPLFKRVCSYTDTADTGADYLASFIYGETFDNEAYILDVLFTKRPMEYTEPALAKKLHGNGANIAWIESNNGGRGFARNVREHLKKIPGNKTSVLWFSQSQNKRARILSNATWVMEHIYFPANWRDRWPELYSDLVRYQREGENEHDDAEDALTGICERMGAAAAPAAQVQTFEGSL